MKVYPTLALAGMPIIAAALFVAGCAMKPTTEEIDQKYTNAQSRYINIDGLNVHYRDAGQGETIVLVHGTASSLHTWDSWAKRLQEDYRVVRMDLPGLGLTGPRNDGNYTVEDDVRFLEQLFERIGVDQFHIAGSSLGGRIAWEYALQNADQVQSLTLLNSLGYPQDSWPPAIELAQWNVIDDLMALYIPRFIYRISLSDIYYDSTLISESVVDRYYELAMRDGNLQAFTDRVKVDLDTDAEQIARISVPTLILWGEEDAYFPVEAAYKFRDDISGSKLVTYSDVAHLPMEEVPEQSVSDFTEFLKAVY